MISCKVNKNKVKHAEFCDVLLPYHEGTVGRLLMPFYFSDVERLRLFFRRTLCQCFFLRRLDKQSPFLARSLFRQGQYFFWRFFKTFFCVLVAFLKKRPTLLIPTECIKTSRA